MSKNDMVMVPRNAVENAAELLQEYNKCSIARDLCAILGQPVQQHLGEPVVLPERKDPTQHWVEPGGVHKAEGWNSYHDEIAKLGPLYTHPVKGEPVAWTWQGSLDTLRGYCPAGVAVFPHKSPGTPIPLYTHPAAADHDEVERLRADLAQMTTFRDNAANHMRRIRAEATAFEKERDTLRANLAKAHELLSEALRSVHADAEKSESSVAVDELEELASEIRSELYGKPCYGPNEWSTECGKCELENRS